MRLDEKRKQHQLLKWLDEENKLIVASLQGRGWRELTAENVNPLRSILYVFPGRVCAVIKEKWKLDVYPRVGFIQYGVLNENGVSVINSASPFTTEETQKKIEGNWFSIDTRMTLFSFQEGVLRIIPMGGAWYYRWKNPQWIISKGKEGYPLVKEDKKKDSSV